jgi:hypothetical protein
MSSDIFESKVGKALPSYSVLQKYSLQPSTLFVKSETKPKRYMPRATPTRSHGTPGPLANAPCIYLNPTLRVAPSQRGQTYVETRRLKINPICLRFCATGRRPLQESRTRRQRSIYYRLNIQFTERPLQDLAPLRPAWPLHLDPAY